VKALLILLITCAAIGAQSKDDLSKKYGQPVAETYVIRPGIIVTASYDLTGQVTEMVIAPQLTDLIKSKSTGLSHETIKEIIDELIPTAERGRGMFGGFFNIGCMPQNDCYGSFNDYEKVIIYYNAGQHDDVNYAVVRWKK
jgi:hypothetical protein